MGESKIICIEEFHMYVAFSYTHAFEKEKKQVQLLYLDLDLNAVWLINIIENGKLLHEVVQ